jgi:hypothetical protein
VCNGDHHVPGWDDERTLEVGMVSKCGYAQLDAYNGHGATRL